MTKIILATSSSYRQEAFRFLDLDFVAQGSDNLTRGIPLETIVEMLPDIGYKL